MLRILLRKQNTDGLCGLMRHNSYLLPHDGEGRYMQGASRLSGLCYLPSTHLTHCRHGTSTLLMRTPHYLLLTKGSQGLLTSLSDGYHKPLTQTFPFCVGGK